MHQPRDAVRALSLRALAGIHVGAGRMLWVVGVVDNDPFGCSGPLIMLERLQAVSKTDESARGTQAGNARLKHNLGRTREAEEVVADGPTSQCGEVRGWPL